MSYEPTVWKSGDVVTSAKLNKLEQGVAGGGVLFLNETQEGSIVTLDKTWQEIHDAVVSGVLPVATHMNPDTGDAVIYVDTVTCVAAGSGDYPYAVDFSGNTTFTTNTTNGYPSLDVG